MRIIWLFILLSISIMGMYEECKKSRASAKSQVMKACNRICQLIAEEDNYTAVHELVSKLK